jgi:hypothetical protein
MTRPAPIRNVFRSISQRTKQLLDRAEGLDVDWKKTNKADSEDFVAFANSARGGAILLGVGEKASAGGRQVPAIVGCDVSDSARLTLINKAKDCSPSVDVQVFVEGAATKTPFLRVEIPSGPHKPYCTKGGTYKTRSDGRNASLLPPDLLALFVDVEGRRFLDTFRAATTELGTVLGTVKVNLEASVKDVQQDVRWANERIGGMIDDLSGALDSQVRALHDALSSAVDDQLRELSSGTEEVQYNLAYMDAGLEAILKQLGLDDTYVLFWRPRVHASIDRLLKTSPSKPPADVYEELRGHRRCRENILLRLCQEKLGAFRVREPKAERRRKA